MIGSQPGSISVEERKCRIHHGGVCFSRHVLREVNPLNSCPKCDVAFVCRLLPGQHPQK